MTLRDQLLRASLEPMADGAGVALDPAFAGLPEMAHGGAIVALFDALGGLRGARRVRARYLRKIPLGTDLTLRRNDTGGVPLALETGTTRFAEGRVSPAATAVDRLVPADASATRPLPRSTSCFVCGVANPIGLRATLAFDDHTVHGVWHPADHVRAVDGTLAPIALTGLLDEAAFWLGALATGESGMTTELDVALLRPAPFGEPVTIVGDRRSVTPRADARYADTSVTALGAHGAPLATARITFVAVRGAARRLVSWLAPTNAPDVIARVFPAYTAQSRD
jgi:acyl-coenzyme A thioesterase PaaI-like protein